MGRFKSGKSYKTRRYTRDLDQILHDDLSSASKINALKHQSFDEYLPGLGQHYCVPCAKYFETDIALKTHERSKVHKRQIKDLKFGPYTPEEAAAGAGRDVEKFLAKQDQQRSIHASEETKEQLSRKEPLASREPEVAQSMETDDVAIAAVETEIVQETTVAPHAAEDAISV